ncbi:6695_t:CDS:1 [Acaulospora morrowiae]|uniref:6695_t:CDS:1 n=1 Tax=Acaulospora morrowiae TaxID=94023 RepID=A0A9N9BEX0_9GLOM|nr:6695_t:CDS:1 [Acaulospora morrowiae]
MANNANNHRPAQLPQIPRLTTPTQQENLQALAPVAIPQHIIAPTAIPQHIAPAAIPQHIVAPAANPQASQHDQFNLIQGNSFVVDTNSTSDAPDFAKTLFEGDNNWP